MNGKLSDQPLGHLALILLLGILIYANSFDVPFVFDDLESIVGNETIRNLGNFLPGGSGLDFHFRRWVAYFTFALNYRFGGYQVGGYHLVNLSVHLGAALLVYVFVRQAFRTPRLAGSRLAPRAGLAALLAALFFVAHPVQTQAVTYVVQRLTSLCTCFYLLALVLYAAARLEPAPGRRRLLLLGGSVFAAVLAMFTKEIAFTLPLAALLFEVTCFDGPWRQRLSVLLPLLLTMAIIPVLVLAGGELSAAGTLRQARLDIPRSHYLLTQFPVIVTYLRLLILPAGQNIDYDYPLYTTLFTPPVLLSGLLLGGLLGAGVWLYRKGRAEEGQGGDPAWCLVAFGIFWFFLTLSVESGLVPLPDVIFEHRLYLASIGPAVALAVVFLLAAPRPTAPLCIAAALIVALGVATWQRNQVWRSEGRLWEDTVRKSPGKVRPLYNFGTYLAEHSRPEEAVPLLTRAVSLDPQHADAWHNLGRAYLLLGRNREAVPALRTAVELAPLLENAALNLASALLRTGQPAEALLLLTSARDRAPARADIRFNLGLAYAGVGNIPLARRELVDLQRLDPSLARNLADVINRVDASPLER